jgi:hypothetical protein
MEYLAKGDEDALFDLSEAEKLKLATRFIGLNCFSIGRPCSFARL